VPTCTVKDQQSNGTNRDASADFCQVLVHSLDVDMRHNHGGTGAAIWTDSPKQIR
jgi:hypothetical protein